MIPKPFELTQESYYTKENPFISNSKVSDFLLSKEYFYRRHIAKDLEFKTTVPIKIGRIVDAMFSQEKIPYQVKVLKRDNSDLYERQKFMDDDEFVTEAQMDDGLYRGQAITREPFYQDYLKNPTTKFQPILQGLAGETPICGMADVTVEDANTFYIDDCKSVSPMKLKSASHWYWNCLEMGYDRQMGAYAYMAEQMGLNHGKPIVCRHIVVTKVRDGVFVVRLFIMPERMVIEGTQKFLAGVNGIVTETAWIDPPLTWESAEMLGPGNREEAYDEDDEGAEIQFDE